MATTHRSSNSMTTAIAAATEAVRASGLFRATPAGLEALIEALGEELRVIGDAELFKTLRSAASYAGARAALLLPEINDPFLTKAEQEAARLNRLRGLQGIVFGALVVSLAQ